MQSEDVIIASDEARQRTLRHRPKLATDTRDAKLMQAYNDEIEAREIQKAILQSKRDDPISPEEASSPPAEPPRRLSSRAKNKAWEPAATNGSDVVHELEADIDWVGGYRIDSYVFVEADIPELTLHAREVYNIPDEEPVDVPTESPLVLKKKPKTKKGERDLNSAWGARKNTSLDAQRKMGWVDEDDKPLFNRREIEDDFRFQSAMPQTSPIQSPVHSPVPSPVHSEASPESAGQDFEDLLDACKELVQVQANLPTEPQATSAAGEDVRSPPRKKAPRLTFITDDFMTSTEGVNNLLPPSLYRRNSADGEPLERNLTKFLTAQGPGPASPDLLPSGEANGSAVDGPPNHQTVPMPIRGPSAVTLSRPVSKRPSRSMTVDLPSNMRRVLPYTIRRTQPATHQPGRIPIHHQGGNVTKNNSRGEIQPRTAKGLGIEYKFKYHLAQGLKVQEGPWPHRLNFGSTLIVPTKNPIFNPRFPPHALIAHAIQNSKCWHQSHDPMVATMEATCAPYLKRKASALYSQSVERVVPPQPAVENLH